MLHLNLYETDDSGRETLSPEFVDLINEELASRGINPQDPSYDDAFGEVELKMADKLVRDYEAAVQDQAVDNFLNGVF